MTASQERVGILGPIEDLNLLQQEINDFIKNQVSKIIDFQMYSIQKTDPETIGNPPFWHNFYKIQHYTYMRYIPQ